LQYTADNNSIFIVVPNGARLQQQQQSLTLPDSVRLTSETDVVELSGDDAALLIDGNDRQAQLDAGRARTLVAQHLLEQRLLSIDSQLRFVWIVNFPLFEYDDNRISSSHHPFTAPIIEHEHLLHSQVKIVGWL
jgi:aspartyl-tRNA synthetase